MFSHKVACVEAMVEMRSCYFKTSRSIRSVSESFADVPSIVLTDH